MSDQQQAKNHWHTLSQQDAISQLNSNSSTGLSESDAQQRLNSHGLNQIEQVQRPGLLKLLVEQFTDLMILILIAAAIVSSLLGSVIDALAIIIIVILNAIVGTVQQHRAYNAIAALKSLASPKAEVIRNSSQFQIDSVQLVIGDIVVLEAGDIVPADVRLIESYDLEINESALTGESLSVAKEADFIAEAECIIAERQNMLFKSTMITRGRAKAIVVATGMQTEIGKIAGLLDHQVLLRTPLQKRLTTFSKKLAIMVLAICLLIFLAGLLRGEPVILMFLTAVSLAVAAIPEALPAIITVALAMGAVKISQRYALVKNLPAVETLGSVTYICSDKTGTLTQNKMHLEKFIVEAEEYDNIPSSNTNLHWQLIGNCLALNNDVNTLDSNNIKGEPTELALYEAAITNQFDKTTLEKNHPRVAEVAFDSERKRMSTIHRFDERYVAFTKGAPESVLPLCQHKLSDTGETPFELNETLQNAEALASQGFRVLALAYKEIPDLPKNVTSENTENALNFLCLVALMDPPREEAAKAVKECIEAGITPVMITGDHLGTARAIAERVGISTESTKAISGKQLDELSMEDFEREVENIRVYARVTPEQKTKIVQALQDKNQFVAMTGDGVNDAPALKKADIGVAMGSKGTAVAREASDMVLLDDNFATIVAAVREGRRIYDNIRKFLKYTMTSNIGEILVLLLAPFIGLAVPLLPIHILWINLVTDGLPGLALSMEKEEKNIMQRPPRPPTETMFAGGMWQHMFFIGFLIAFLTLFTQAWAVYTGSPNWQTMVFTVLTFSQLVNVMVIRSDTESLMSLGLMSNKPLIAAILLTVILQLAIIYTPLLNEIFKTTPLTVFELAFCIMVSMMVFVVVETQKWFARKKGITANTI